MNEKTTCDILIRNTSILDENFQIRRSIFIAIQNGTILSITSEEPSCLTATDARPYRRPYAYRAAASQRCGTG